LSKEELESFSKKKEVQDWIKHTETLGKNDKNK